MATATFQTGTPSGTLLYPSGNIDFTIVTATFTGLVSSLSYGPNGVPGQNGQLAIYSDLAGAPHTLLGSTASTDQAIGLVSGVQTQALLTSVPVVSGTVYWLAMSMTNSPSPISTSNSPTSGLQSWGYGSFPTTASYSNGNTWKHWIQANGVTPPPAVPSSMFLGL